MRAIDQVCLLYAADPARIAVAGLSDGASMAALLVTRHPRRFKAVMMHSGIPPGTAHSTLSAVGAMHGHRLVKPLVVTPGAMAAFWPPLMVIHGSVDRVVSAHNGRAAVQVWSVAAGAKESKLGHPWSGGAANEPYSDGHGPDASRMLWNFAAEQFAI